MPADCELVTLQVTDLSDPENQRKMIVNAFYECQAKMNETYNGTGKSVQIKHKDVFVKSTY